MFGVVAASLVTLQLLSPATGWAAVGGSAQPGSPETGCPRAMLIQYDEGYEHHHHGSVLIGCVHVPDECHHAAEHAGYHHFRTVFDPVTCHHEPHLACVADE